MSAFLLILSAIQDLQTRLEVKGVFESAGHRIIDSDGCAQAGLLLNNGLDPDLVLLDRSSIDSVAASQFRELSRCARPARTCLVARTNDLESRQEAIQRGIGHFLNLPVTPEDLRGMVRDLKHAGIQHQVGVNLFPSSMNGAALEMHALAAVPPLPYIEDFGDGTFFLAASPKMLEIHRQVKLLADTDVNVLILGESGTGKEVIARLIHKKSQRCGKKFLKVNCAALPADLLESELFGHKQGAFTGAIKDLPGKFEQAGGGTLFLDEIGEIDVHLQAKLLHVLEDGEFTRLGAQHGTKVDVRVLAATNIQMESALSAGTFREDLYYRLNVFTITVPPLRERREEIPYLIDETIRRASAEFNVDGAASFSTRLVDAALLCDWPGNLRELRNFVTRTMIMRDPDAALRQLECKIAPSKVVCDSLRTTDESSPGLGMKSIVRDIKGRTEAKMILEALEVAGWNRRHAARSLDISYRALLYKIQQHHLTPQGAANAREVASSVPSLR